MKKIIPFILILVAAITVFIFAPKAEAQEGGTCIYTATNKTTGEIRTLSPFFGYTSAQCVNQDTPTERWVVASFTPTGPISQNPALGGATPKADPNKTELEKAVEDLSCVSFWKFDAGACISAFAYYIFFALPAFILAIVANLFNALLGSTIDGSLYGASSFIGEAWKVVRDLSNIFFIIILLYAAIEMILGIGHGGKKVIGSVIIMAMLINFSMFFTKVVVDSSNILALVFYNKIIVKDNPANPYKPTLGEKKDIGGAIAGSFNPARLMTPELFATKMKVNGVEVPIRSNSSIILAIIFTSCAIFLFAAYAFFISGLSFLGRMIELWILMIFSPFAFMSFALPKLAGVEGIGWTDWLKRLLRAAFMAPIFMFFLYLISKIIQKPVLDGLEGGTNFLSVLLLIVIPAMIQIILLLKATEYAKKGSGQLGEITIGAGKALAGLAIGGGFAVAGMAGRSTVGAFMKGAATGDNVNQKFARGETMNTWDTLRGGALHYGTGTLWTKAQNKISNKVNDSQEKMEGATHARKTLDDAAKARYHKDYDQLTSRERKNIKDTIDLNILTKNRIPGLTTAAGVPINYGNKQKFSELQDDEQEALKNHLAAMTSVDRGDIHHGSMQTSTQADQKVGIGTTILQSARTGTYDPRNIANLVVGEQDKALNKFATGLTGAFAKSFRAGFNTAGVNFGAKAEGKFLKDLGTTISESLKSANIKVDLSSVGEEKKEDGHGGGH